MNRALFYQTEQALKDQYPRVRRLIHLRPWTVRGMRSWYCRLCGRDVVPDGKCLMAFIERPSFKTWHKAGRTWQHISHAEIVCWDRGACLYRTAVR